MERIFIRPAPGKVVRDPVTKRALPAEGVSVVPSIFWNRRIKDGSVVVGKKPEKSENKDMVKPLVEKGGK